MSEQMQTIKPANAGSNDNDFSLPDWSDDDDEDEDEKAEVKRVMPRLDLHSVFHPIYTTLSTNVHFSIFQSRMLAFISANVHGNDLHMHVTKINTYVYLFYICLVSMF